MSALDLGLELIGVPDATVTELDAQLPALLRIEAAFQQIEPIVQAVWPDIVAVTPLVKDLIAFAKSKQTP
jgi:hypothetical protein